MMVNNLYQPLRAILSMINQYLTSKTSGYNRLRYPVLQMLWGIITSTNVDYAELMWEEFVQAIQTFLVDKANLGVATQKGKNTKLHVIPYSTREAFVWCGQGWQPRRGRLFGAAEAGSSLGGCLFGLGSATIEDVGVLEELHYVSRMMVNNLYQPLRAILSMINQYLTSKTSGYNRLRYPVLQMLWGIITSTNVDYAELMWEEFVQAIQTFLVDKANLGVATQKGKNTKLHVIPYCQFTKLIICYLGRTHNINQRLASPFHLAEEDHRLGNLKFFPKGEEDEVLGMQIPKELITDSISNASFGHSTKQSKPAPAKKPKVALENPLDPSPAKQSKRDKVRKVHKGKSPLKLVDEDKEVHHELEPQGKVEEYDRRIPMTEEAPTGPSAQPENDTSTNIVCDTLSPINAKPCTKTDKTNSEGDTQILNIIEEQQEDVANQVNLEEKTVEVDEGQAGSDRGKPLGSRPQPERVLTKEDQAGPNPGQSHVALVGPNLEPMHEDFVATVYPQFFNDKPTEEEPDKANMETKVESMVIVLIHQASSSVPLLFTLVIDLTPPKPFFNDKPTEEEPDKANMETKVESMVIVLIHQASSSVPLLFTLVIDLTPPKPVSPTIQAPFFTATTATSTTTLPLPQQQSSLDPDLASRVSALKQVCAKIKKRHKLQDKTVQVLSSRVFTLELQDLPHKIDETVNEVVKEAVQIALQAPLKERFKYLSKADMKEILHDRMFDEFLAEKDKSCKRRQDDQDPPSPPTKESEQNNKKKREAPSSSSKQKFVPYFEQPVDEVPIPDDVNILDLEDTDIVHLSKIKSRPDWLKPVPEEDRQETPKPDWDIPPNDLPEPENN
nr:hypothetical protein [Tanacetum cinerariifolium]